LKIVLEDLSFSYRGGKKVFEHLDLVLPGRHIVAITGPNGSGKTTLLKLIAGILEPDSGRVIFDGVRSEFLRFGFVFQNPSEQFVHFTVEREVGFALENFGYDSDVIAIKVSEILKEFGLYSKRGSSPDELSGGEQQKLSIASSVVYEPKIFLMDEPTSYLDEPGKKLFFETVSSLRRRGYSILWVTQDPSELKLSDYVLLLEEGRVTFFENTKRFLKDGYDSI